MFLLSKGSCFTVFISLYSILLYPDLYCAVKQKTLQMSGINCCKLLVRRGPRRTLAERPQVQGLDFITDQDLKAQI